MKGSWEPNGFENCVINKIKGKKENWKRLRGNCSAASVDEVPWHPGGGERLPYKTDRVACQKIQMKLLKETNVGVAQA